MNQIAAKMDLEGLWSPAAFSRSFGEDKHTIVNTRTGKCIPNMPLKKFWDGFENLSKRMTDELWRNMLFAVTFDIDTLSASLHSTNQQPNRIKGTRKNRAKDRKQENRIQTK